MYFKKTMAGVITILYLVICWVVLRWETPGYLSSGMMQIYDIHRIADGYYSQHSFLVLYTAVPVFYVISRMQDDKAHTLIRYQGRKHFWKTKMLKALKCVLQVSVIQIVTDIGFMLMEFPVDEVINSRILLYLALFFPDVFFYYVFFVCVFFIWRTMFCVWKSFLCTAAMSLLMDLLLCAGLNAAWNPFFFLNALNTQIRYGVNEADLMLSYLNILSLDVIVGYIAWKRYDEMDFVR